MSIQKLNLMLLHLDMDPETFDSKARSYMLYVSLNLNVSMIVKFPNRFLSHHSTSVHAAVSCGNTMGIYLKRKRSVGSLPANSQL